MRLGVVLTGAGACAAASAGALTWLLDAGVSPCAVCGMQAAAWPAALYLAGGLVGGWIGGKLYGRVSVKWLKWLFAGFLFYAGVKYLL